jgi:hypothetical protein
MGLKEAKSVKKQDEVELKKKRFRNAYLEIYIVGKYNKLLDIMMEKIKKIKYLKTMTIIQ